MNKVNASLLLILVFSLELSSQEIISVPTNRSIKKMDLSSGKRDIAVKMSDGSLWEMIISVPEFSDGDSLDVILALHWGVKANQNEEFMNCLILPSIDMSKYIVIAPLADRQVWWRNPKETQLLSLLKYMRKHWPIRNVIVVGYSDGGTGAIYFASNHPDKFDATIALAGNYYSVSSFEIPTYVIHSIKDELFDYQRSSEIMSAAGILNDNLKFTTSETLTHFQGCGYVELLSEGFEWVENKLD